MIDHIVPWQRAARQTDSMRAAAEADWEEVRGEQGLMTGLLETEDGRRGGVGLMPAANRGKAGGSRHVRLDLFHASVISSVFCGAREKRLVSRDWRC